MSTEGYASPLIRCFVTGDTRVFLADFIDFLYCFHADDSYTLPSGATTGSVGSSRVKGHTGSCTLTFVRRASFAFAERSRLTLEEEASAIEHREKVYWEKFFFEKMLYYIEERPILYRI